MTKLLLQLRLSKSARIFSRREAYMYFSNRNLSIQHQTTPSIRLFMSKRNCVWSTHHLYRFITLSNFVSCISLVMALPASQHPHALSLHHALFQRKLPYFFLTPAHHLHYWGISCACSNWTAYRTGTFKWHQQLPHLSELHLYGNHILFINMKYCAHLWSHGYMIFFSEADRLCKRLRNSRVRISQYMFFSAPWFRKIMKRGSRVLSCKKGPLKKGLSKWLGSLSMAWKLASFQKFEKDFAEEPPLFILSNILYFLFYSFSPICHTSNVFSPSLEHLAIDHLLYIFIKIHDLKPLLYRRPWVRYKGLLKLSNLSQEKYFLHDSIFPAR